MQIFICFSLNSVCSEYATTFAAASVVWYWKIGVHSDWSYYTSRCLCIYGTVCIIIIFFLFLFLASHKKNPFSMFAEVFVPIDRVYCLILSACPTQHSFFLLFVCFFRFFSGFAAAVLSIFFVLDYKINSNLKLIVCVSYNTDTWRFSRLFLLIFFIDVLLLLFNLLLFLCKRSIFRSACPVYNKNGNKNLNLRAKNATKWDRRNAEKINKNKRKFIISIEAVR